MICGATLTPWKNDSRLGYNRTEPLQVAVIRFDGHNESGEDPLNSIFHAIAMSVFVLVFLWLRKRYLGSLNNRAKVFLFNFVATFVFFLNAYDAANDFGYLLHLISRANIRLPWSRTEPSADAQAFKFLGVHPIRGCLSRW